MGKQRIPPQPTPSLPQLIPIHSGPTQVVRIMPCNRRLRKLDPAHADPSNTGYLALPISPQALSVRPMPPAKGRERQGGAEMAGSRGGRVESMGARRERAEKLRELYSRAHAFFRMRRPSYAFLSLFLQLSYAFFTLFGAQENASIKCSILRFGSRGISQK